jgi:mannose-6-phosphate isomerase
MELELNYPLRFDPIVMERLWGGRRLESTFGRSLPREKLIGESWEISDYAANSSVVANGPLKGLSLRDLMSRSPMALLGAGAFQDGQSESAVRFPFLVKWIDAREKLSLQVHPPDGHPRLPRGELGKTECWYIVDASDGSEIYLGLRRGIDRLALERELGRGTIDRCLNVVPVRRGDFFFVPAGTPHGIGGGVLLAEIQQTSDTTFRLWDWKRTDPTTGTLRALHIEEALDSINYDGHSSIMTRRVASESPVGSMALLDGEQNRYFVVKHRSVDCEQHLGESDRFHVLVCLSGRGTVRATEHSVTMSSGDCLLLPPGNTFICRPDSHVEFLDACPP